MCARASMHARVLLNRLPSHVHHDAERLTTWCVARTPHVHGPAALMPLAPAQTHPPSPRFGWPARPEHADKHPIIRLLLRAARGPFPVAAPFSTLPLPCPVPLSQVLFAGQLRFKHEPVEWVYDGLGPALLGRSLAARRGVPLSLALVYCGVAARLGLAAMPLLAASVRSTTAEGRCLGLLLKVCVGGGRGHG